MVYGKERSSTVTFMGHFLIINTFYTTMRFFSSNQLSLHLFQHIYVCIYAYWQVVRLKENNINESVYSWNALSLAFFFFSFLEIVIHG